MKTIFTANIVSDRFKGGSGALFGGTSHEADEVHRRPGRLRRAGDPAAGEDGITRNGFMTLSIVVNKYLPDNTALTAAGAACALYISDNKGATDRVCEKIFMK